MPRDYVQEKLAKMLVEPVARSLFDSGGFYGTAVERNTGMTLADWRNKPKMTYRVHGWHGKNKDVLEIIPSIPMFHWLSELFEMPDPWWKRQWDNYQATESGEKDYNGNGFVAYLEKRFPDKCFECHSATNTYNYPNDFQNYSQDMVFAAFCSDDGDWHVVISIHGGCDIRSGYTFPAFFKLKETGHGDFWLETHNLIIQSKHWLAQDERYAPQWETQKGVKFVGLAQSLDVHYYDWEDYPVIVFDPDDEEETHEAQVRWLTDMLRHKDHPDSRPLPPILVAQRDDEQGIMYCPLTGFELELVSEIYVG